MTHLKGVLPPDPRAPARAAIPANWITFSPSRALGWGESDLLAADAQTARPGQTGQDELIRSSEVSATSLKRA
ncbi:hypothetical protein PSCLAVI8L_110025 [Pseudoclavibacter sp. 8L]|nr:hypothetical protein PSCLAVI8L_110025 [Pseudoclavibacter sp. 8L]